MGGVATLLEDVATQLLIARTGHVWCGMECSVGVGWVGESSPGVGCECSGVYRVGLAGLGRRMHNAKVLYVSHLQLCM